MHNTRRMSLIFRIASHRISNDDRVGSDVVFRAVLKAQKPIPYAGNTVSLSFPTHAFSR